MAAFVQHAKLFSASGAPRWSVCTASALDTADMEDVTTFFAAEGTVAHELADRCVKEELTPSFFVDHTWAVLKLREGKKTRDVVVYTDLESFKNGSPEAEIVSTHEITINKVMANHVQGYLDYCQSLVTPGAEVGYETRVDYSPWAAEGFGTNDFSVCNDGILEVVDLKYGHIKVYAKDNEQALLYALGKYNELRLYYEFKKIRIHIYQPRLDHIDVWECDIDYLLEFAERIKKITTDIMNGIVHYKPGKKQCEFCKKNTSCDALNEYIMSIVSDEFDPVYMLNLKGVEDDASGLSLLLPHIPLIRKWCDNHEKRALELAMSGVELPGYKLVRTAGRRKYADEQEVISELQEHFDEDEYAPRKLVGITELESMIGKKHEIFDLSKGFVIKPQGKIVLVPEDDRRKSVSEEVSSDFDDVTEET